MKHGSLFSGIGGFDLAAQWIGWENAFHCEIAEFPRKVLHHYWPNAASYENIKETDFTQWRGKIDVISGGFPCQPYSLAGKRLGKEDDRHLWPEMLRCIREIKPRWVVGENVFGIVNWNGGLVFDEVQADLEAEGYEVQAFVLPACAVNAPHRRDRVWFVAYAAGNGTPQNGRSGANEGGRETSIFSQDEGRESKTIQPTGLCSLQRFVAHANNSGSEKSIVQHSDLFAGSVGNNEQTTVDADNKRRSARLRQIQDADAEISERHDDAEFGNASDGLAPDTESGRRRFWPTENIGETAGEINPLGDEVKICLQQFSADATEQGLEGCAGKRIQREIDGFTGQYNEIVSDGDVANAGRVGMSGQPINAGASERIGQRGAGAETIRDFRGIEQWDRFPTTQPTIRGGNDGLSSRLDGITFPKWRNESIKAYGNAVVPQVVYQIFKAIQAYETP